MQFRVPSISFLEKRFAGKLILPFLIILAAACVTSFWISQSQQLVLARSDGERMAALYAKTILLAPANAEDRFIRNILEDIAQDPRVRGISLLNRTTGEKLEAGKNDPETRKENLNFQQNVFIRKHPGSAPEEIHLELTITKPSLREILLIAGGQLLILLILALLLTIFVFAIHRHLVARPLRILHQEIDAHEKNGKIPQWKEDLPPDELGVAMRAYEAACRHTQDTEKALLVSQDRLRILSDNLPNSFLYQCGPDGKGGISFSYVGESVRQVMGVTPEEIYKDGGVLRRNIDPEYFEEFDRIEQHVVRMRAEFNYECPFIFPDGSRHWVQLLSRPTQMPDGEFLWQGVFIDVTESREIDAKLQRSRADALAILNALPDPVFVHPFPSGDHHFTHINQSTCDFLGMTREELLSVGPGQVGEPSPEEVTRIRTELREHKRSRFEVNFLHKNGKRFPGEICSSLIEFSGRTVIISVARSLTDQKQREAELKNAMTQIETTNRAMSAFLANLSHEIRTPLNGIIGFSEMLARTSENVLHRQQATAITSSGRTLLVLVNDILDLSKIESGRLVIRPTAVALSTLLNDVRAFFATQAQEKNLQLRVACDSQIPPEIMLDEVRLRQILVNLVGNALKFTDEGEITISAQRMAQQENESDSPNNYLHIQIAIADTGPGISDKEKEQIFEPFEQGRSGEQAGSIGSGLGLTISRRLAHLLNASLHVKDNPDGKGSVFILDFPEIEIAWKFAATNSALPQPPISPERPSLEHLASGTRQEILTQARQLRQHLRIKDALALSSALKSQVPELNDFAKTLETAAEHCQVDQMLGLAQELEALLQEDSDQ